MVYQLSEDRLKQYISKIDAPVSAAFQEFLHDYVVGDVWARSRGEEDLRIWQELSGQELETAKQIILDGLEEMPDPAYMRAVGVFKDDRAIPILERIIERSQTADIKLLAAQALYELCGYPEYLPMLEDACKNCDDKLLHNYLKASIRSFLAGVPDSEQLRILLLLAD